MTPLRVHYSDHVVREMRKLRPPVTRQVLRLILAHGRREYEFTRAGQEHWHSVLRIENRHYRLQWIQGAGYVKIVSVWEVGEFD